MTAALSDAVQSPRHTADELPAGGGLGPVAGDRAVRAAVAGGPGVRGPEVGRCAFHAAGYRHPRCCCRRRRGRRRTRAAWLAARATLVDPCEHHRSARPSGVGHEPSRDFAARIGFVVVGCLWRGGMGMVVLPRQTASSDRLPPTSSRRRKATTQRSPPPRASPKRIAAGWRADEPTDEELAGGISAAEVLQRLTRSRAADGSETFTGWLRVPLAGRPADGESSPGVLSRLQSDAANHGRPAGRSRGAIRPVQLLPYGARFDLKLAQTVR